MIAVFIHLHKLAMKIRLTKNQIWMPNWALGSQNSSCPVWAKIGREYFMGIVEFELDIQKWVWWIGRKNGFVF